MVSIKVAGLQKRYGRRLVLDGVDFEVEEGQMLTLLGSSGCGKSTTLRSVAGLEMPDGGSIRFGDRVLFDKSVNVAPRRRDVGMVFQILCTMAEYDGFAECWISIAIAISSVCDVAFTSVRDIGSGWPK